MREVFIKASGIFKEKNMDMEYSLPKKEVNMKDSGKMINLME